MGIDETIQELKREKERYEKNLALGAHNTTTTLGQSSVTLKTTSKGQTYWDIKIYEGDAEQIDLEQLVKKVREAHNLLQETFPDNPFTTG
jgi:hypothetical protein